MGILWLACIWSWAACPSKCHLVSIVYWRMVPFRFYCIALGCPGSMWESFGPSVLVLEHPSGWKKSAFLLRPYFLQYCLLQEIQAFSSELECKWAPEFFSGNATGWGVCLHWTALCAIVCSAGNTGFNVVQNTSADLFLILNFVRSP